MKKYLLLLILTIFLSSCFWDKDKEEKENVEDIKKELLGENNKKIKDNKVVNESESNSGILKEEVNNEDKESDYKEEKNFIEKKYLTEEKYIELDDFKVEDFKTLEKEITGKTLTHVDKITVSFSNKESDFPDYSYTLKKFKAGDSKFLYRAFKKYESIDYGENIYLFEAYKGDKISKLEFKVNLHKKKVKPVSLDELPEDSVFGSPRKLGNGKVTYTDIKGLEISNVGDIDLKLESDSITSYLGKIIDGWFYWNTFRYIKDKSGISFYVVTKDSKTNVYKYFKHYYNGNGLYGILELEVGNMDSGEDLKDLNKKLTEKNDDFTITSISDSLFKKLTN